MTWVGPPDGLGCCVVPDARRPELRGPIARVRWVVYGALDDAGTWVLRGDEKRRRSRDERERQRLSALEELSFGAELVALCGLAIAQPVLDVFARSPEWFAYRGARAGDIVLFALLVTVLPPLLLWALLAPVRLVSRPLRRGLHLVALGGLTAVLLLQGLRTSLAWGASLTVIVAFGLGALVAVLYPAVRAVRSWVLALSIAPLVFIALFLGNSATGDLVFASGDVELAASAADAPVVVLVLDELPTGSIVDDAGDIDPVRFPNLARLAGDATWYRNFTTQSGSTIHAVPSILSGREPSKGSNPFWFEHPDNLFTLLGGSHKLFVWEVMTQLCAPSLCRDGGVARSASHDAVTTVRSLLGDASGVWSALLRPDGEAPDPETMFDEDQLAAGSEQEALVEEALDANDEPVPWSDFEDDRQLVSQPRRFTEFLDSLQPRVAGEPPGLHLAHVLLPHRPWHFFPDGTEYAEPERTLVVDDLRYPEDAPWHARVQLQREILQAQYADRLVGQMLDRLEENELYDDALVVVVADHGVGFTPGHGVRVYTGGNEADLLWAPLLIKAPRQSDGVRTDINVTSPDVLPTIAELVGVDVPWKLDGRSAAGATADAPITGTKRYHWFEDIARGGDAVLELDPVAGLERMLATAFSPASGRNDWVGGLYEITPLRDIVDRPLSELRIVDGPPAVARIDDLDALLAGDRPLRADITGGIVGDPSVRVGGFVAVSLNGTIVGVSPLEPFASDERAFDVLVHPGQFVSGRQQVRVFKAVIDSDGEPVLAELEVQRR